MSEQKLVNPKKLYPMVTIESIDPEIFEKVVKETKNGTEIPPVRVIYFEGYYFIWEGNYEMLAANILGREKIAIEEVSFAEQNARQQEERIKEKLKAVGKNALYDFEALGGFVYSEYPAFYEKD